MICFYCDKVQSDDTSVMQIQVTSYFKPSQRGGMCLLGGVISKYG